MRVIQIGKAAAEEIRRAVGSQSGLNRRLAVEVMRGLDGEVFLAVYVRLDGTPWWQIHRFDVRIADEAAELPSGMPIQTAVKALNAAAGRVVAKMSRLNRLGATCVQCGTAHGEWVESEIGAHCPFCGWVVGTRPRGHVEPGDRFWIPIMGRVVVHPRTRVRVLEAHNQVTGCARDERLWAKSGELPKEPLELRDVPKALPGYEHILCEVVELPKKWDPAPYPQGGASEG
jgi:hypothetical protein